jgi:hypothetical protein
MANPGPQRRRITFKVLAGIFAAGSFGGLFGVAVIVAWSDTADGGIHRVHDMGFGALFGAILTVGFVVQTWRPERMISPMHQTGAVALATLLGGVLALSGFAISGVFVAVAYLILVFIHPSRSQVLRPEREGFSWLLAALTVIGAIPLGLYAWRMAELQRNGLAADPHVRDGHWATMGAMAIGIVLTGLLSSLKLPGWRITAWSAGSALFLYGLISLVYPQLPGAEGTGWAWAAISGGVLFGAAAAWEGRRAKIRRA